MIKKYCVKCKILKPLSEYHKNRNRRDGCAAKCKECCSKERRKYTDRDNIFRDIKILNAYINTKSINKTNKICNSSKPYISKLLNKCGITERTKNIKRANREFFKTIDTEEKAYILGFTLADGCVTINKTNRQIHWCVNTKDRNILVKIKEAMNIESEIRDILTSIDKRNNKRYKQSYLKIGGKQLTEDLGVLGVKPRKSLKENINFKMIPKHLQRHFWRGVIDGDGSVRFVKQSKCKTMLGMINLYCSEIMCNKFKKFIEREAKEALKSKIYYHHGIYNLSISKATQVSLLAKTLYQNSSIYLERKYKTAMQIIDYYSEVLQCLR